MFKKTYSSMVQTQIGSQVGVLQYSFEEGTNLFTPFSYVYITEGDDIIYVRRPHIPLLQDNTVN